MTPQPIHILCAMLLTQSVIARAAQIVVRVPSDTPADAQLYVAGSLAAVGNWKPDGLALARQPDGTYTADVTLGAGETLEFKITRGSWETVEKNADGSERENRILDAETQRVELTVERWASGGVETASTVEGDLRIEVIDSTHLGAQRTLRVWLPNGYEQDAARRYPVLYLHDGQNLFDRRTSAFGSEWEVDETLTKRIARGAVPPVIVVGIDNGGAARINEYTFDADQLGGGAERHERFLLDEVIPAINERYRTLGGPRHTLVGGSSLGGIVSLELAMRHPDVFGGALAMSPALWWADRVTLRRLEAGGDRLRQTVVYLDMGTREGGDNATHARLAVEARDLLARRDVAHQFHLAEGAAHNEAAWAARFGDAIEYLLREPEGK